MQEAITFDATMTQVVGETVADKIARIKRILEEQDFIEILNKDVRDRAIPISKRFQGTHAIVILVRRDDHENV